LKSILHGFFCSTKRIGVSLVRIDIALKTAGVSNTDHDSSLREIIEGHCAFLNYSAIFEMRKAEVAAIK